MEYRKFELVSKYSPTGDQPQAIEKLVNGLKEGKTYKYLKNMQFCHTFAAQN